MTYLCFHRQDAEGFGIYFKLAIALVLGIFSIENRSPFYILGFGAILITTIFACKIFFKRLNLKMIWLIVFFCIGAFTAYLSQTYETNGLYPVENNFVTVTGYVCEIPKKNGDRYSCVIKTESAQYGSKTYEVSENIRLSSDTPIEYAQKVQVDGFLERINLMENRSDFDYRTYYKSKDIFYSITEYDLKVSGKEKLWGFIHWGKCIKLKMTELVEKHFSGDKKALIDAILIGDKSGLSDELSDVMNRTNTMRMLYPAYLHIFLITALVNLLFVFLNRSKKEYIIILALTIYAMFNFGLVIMMKSALLVILTILARKKYGAIHYPDIASIVVISMLIVNPLLVYHCGFIISVVMGWLFFMLKLPLLELFGFIRSWRLRQFIVCSLISTIGIMPVIAYFFYGMGIYGPILTIICSIPVILIIFLFPFFTLETLIFGKSIVIKGIIWLGVSFLEKIPYAVDKIPFSSINIGRPSFIEIITFYLVVILIRLFYLYGWEDTKTKITTLFVACGTAFVVFVWLYSSAHMYINFVSVGQGDASLIRLPKGDVIIVDGGGTLSYSDYNNAEEKFVPYLKSEGINTIDMAIVTHYHTDHCLGTIAALENFKVKSVVMPAVTPGDEYRVKIENLARKQGAKIHYVNSGDKIKFSSGAQIDIISPDLGDDAADNEASIVFSVKWGKFSALFMADAPKEVELEHISDFSDVNVIKIGHHGSDTSTSQEFLDVTKPEVAVICVGKNNSYGLPDTQVLERLSNSGVDILRTDEQGDISLMIEKSGNAMLNTFYYDNFSNVWRSD